MSILVTIPEACKQTSTCRSSLYEIIKRGELRAVKRGKRTLIRSEDLRQWADSLPALAPADARAAA